ncbi:outer membrane protein assembly factor BamE [Sphingobium sufflavum]|uniref:outer membrane protein assembly factor BamE n=1 Tax=Sphingobium sufflavum TaxID=1129547 RepID=UPI001F412AC7|nr:outer membrane protein assembly factor BamE [Sphingobium sufflavum]MCE7795145.1 outer membrane protein assembly factor BamE [Sphingobium sufflavum]
MHPIATRLILVAGAAALLAGLGGCTRVRTHQGYQVDKLLVDSIAAGVDNKASVEGALGRPSFASQFGPEEWYYVSREMRALAFSSPKPISQTVLRVRFDPAGNVSAVDHIGMEQVAKVGIEGASTPTAGRKRGFLQEIFGNIGAVGAMGGGGGAGGAGGGGASGQ